MSLFRRLRATMTRHKNDAVILKNCLRDVSRLPSIPLTEVETAELMHYYERFGITPTVRFYEVSKGLGIPFNPQLLPADFYFRSVIPFLIRPSSWQIDDKNMYDTYFPDVLRPKTIAKKIGQRYYDAANMPICSNAFLDKVSNSMPCILKKSTGVGCGTGIMVLKKSDDMLALKNLDFDYIIQTLACNHPNLIWTNTKALCTLRVYTLRYYEKTIVTATALRVGGVDSFVDNLCAGGVVIRVDEETGTTVGGAFSLSSGFSDSFNGGAKPHGHRIPFFQEAKDLCVHLCERFPISLSIGWDVAITEKGPMLIECNLPGSDINIVQLACKKPFLGEFTETILAEMMGNR